MTTCVQEQLASNVEVLLESGTTLVQVGLSPFRASCSPNAVRTQHFNSLRGAGKGDMTTCVQEQLASKVEVLFESGTTLAEVGLSLFRASCSPNAGRTQHSSSLRGSGKGVWTTSVRIKSWRFA